MGSAVDVMSLKDALDVEMANNWLHLRCRSVIMDMRK